MQNHLNIIYLCIKVAKTLKCVIPYEMKYVFSGLLCRTVDYSHALKYNLTKYFKVLNIVISKT